MFRIKKSRIEEKIMKKLEKLAIMVRLIDRKIDETNLLINKFDKEFSEVEKLCKKIGIEFEFEDRKPSYIG